MKLNDCCNTDALTLVKRLYQSNADIFDLRQCPCCSNYWLYRNLEEKWWDNLQLKEDEYEEWYIPLAENELEQVYKMELSFLAGRTGFTYIQTTQASTNGNDWRRIIKPAEASNTSDFSPLSSA